MDKNTTWFKYFKDLKQVITYSDLKQVISYSVFY